MNVLLTGAHGDVGTALRTHLADRDEYAFTYLDRDDPDVETVVADVSESEAIRPAFDDQDAVIHLAGDRRVDAPWPSVLENNVVGTIPPADAGRPLRTT